MTDRQRQDNLREITSFLSGVLSGRKAVIGISGGIDSATVLMLISKVLEKEDITALFMPDDRTPESDYKDVRELSEASGVEIETLNIQPMVDSFRKTLKATEPRAIGNVKARIRMINLYYYANTGGGLVVGTTNRSENLIGYFTKYGDGACDLEPIIGLYKTQVRELASDLNVPISIRDKRPSAGLWESQFDEDEIGMSYEELDRILVDLFDRNSGDATEKHTRIRRMFLDSEHKRRMPLEKDN